MSRILKYALVAGGQTLAIHVVRWLFVDFQPDGLLHIWAEVGPNGPVLHELVVVLTGDNAPEGGTHIGSAQRQGRWGPEVLHVYEVGRE